MDLVPNSAALANPERPGGCSHLDRLAASPTGSHCCAQVSAKTSSDAEVSKAASDPVILLTFTQGCAYDGLGSPV